VVAPAAEAMDSVPMAASSAVDQVVAPEEVKEVEAEVAASGADEAATDLC
jgi:hypothetical protein